MFLALKEIKQSRLRSSMVVVIMTLIIWLVLFVAGLAAGLGNENASAIKAMPVSHFIIQEDAGERIARSTVSDQQLRQIKQQYGSAVMPLQLQQATITSMSDTNKTDVTYFGIDFTTALAPQTTLDALDDKSVVIDDSFKTEGYAIGDKFKDERTGIVFTITGFTSGQAYSHTPVIYLSTVAFKQIATPSATKKAGVNVVALRITDDEAQQLAVKGMTVVTKSAVVKQIPGYKEEQGSLTMMIAFLIGIATFVLAAFFYVITIQKMSQYGVLKALGATNRYLAKSLLLQIIFLALISIVISVLLTLGVAQLLPATMPFELSLPLVSAIIAIFVVVALLGSLLSLYRVFKVDPIEAIGGAGE